MISSFFYFTANKHYASPNQYPVSENFVREGCQNFSRSSGPLSARKLVEAGKMKK